MFYAASADSSENVSVSGLYIYPQMGENMSICTWLLKECDKNKPVLKLWLCIRKVDSVNPAMPWWKHVLSLVYL